MTENEELYCIGCGAKIQSEDKTEPGYTPRAAIQKGLENNELYCQRCFRLRHYNEVADVSLTDDVITCSAGFVLVVGDEETGC